MNTTNNFDDLVLGLWEQCINWKKSDIEFYRKKLKDQEMVEIGKRSLKDMIESYRKLCNSCKRKPKL